MVCNARFRMMACLMLTVLAGFVFCVCIAEAQPTDPSGLAIIVNLENPVESLDKIETKIYYLRIVNQNWPESRVPIRPANYSPYLPIKEFFLKRVLRLNNQQMDSYFKQKESSQMMPLPANFSTEEQVVNYVAGNKGAIGYISQSSVSKYSKRVKVVFEIK
jgi:ABC-type phosphate transport system substrate-binding protein